MPPSGGIHIFQRVDYQAGWVLEATADGHLLYWRKVPVPASVRPNPWPPASTPPYRYGRTRGPNIDRAEVRRLVTGISLLRRAPWARTLAIVIAFLGLIHPLTGTLLGIYTLWVLLPSTSGQQYEQTAVA